MSTMPFFERRSFASEVLLNLRVRLLQVILGFTFLTALVGWLALMNTGMDMFGRAPLLLPLAMLLSLAMFLMVSRRHLIDPVSILVLAYLLLLAPIMSGGDPALLIVTLMLVTISSALLANRQVNWIVNGIAIVQILFFTFQPGSNPHFADFPSALLFLMTFGVLPPVVGLLLRYFIAVLQRTTLEAQRAATLLEASAIIGQSVSQLLDLDELLALAVDTIRERFSFYHVQIFLSDSEQRYTHLHASTGEAGKQLLARQHRLPIDAATVIGRVTRSGETITASATLREGRYAYDELLPDTRAELGVPIRDNEGIIGVLDVQSSQVQAFTFTEIQALQVIANQLAVAIRNARLFDEQERNINENKRLFIESETNLREIQRLNRQLTRQVWNEYLRSDRRIAGVTLEGRAFRNQANWSQRMIEAGQRRRPVSVSADDKEIIAVPIELRGEVVGAIEIETSSSAASNEKIDMIRAISQRLAVSLDNARLFEEAQEATAQEQSIGEMVALYQSAESVDELLRITLEGLSETLGAEEGAIRLGVLPEGDLQSLSIQTTGQNPHGESAT